jgi:hypothetical protein
VFLTVVRLSCRTNWYNAACCSYLDDVQGFGNLFAWRTRRSNELTHMIYYLFSIAVDVYTIRDEKRLYVPASCTFGVTGGGDSVSFTLKLAVF